MSNDPTSISATPEIESSEPISHNTNYSRWMTDMAGDIACLKLYQLAIPGAHNSGVDWDGKFDVGREWAACQYKGFFTQLAAGARYLDLRLVDDSYKKDIGGGKIPQYKFVEVFHFKHGPVSVGRTLQYLIEVVENFSAANPDEIIFIDFRKYDRGRNYASDSLFRCLPKFSPIKDRLIPSSASDLSIEEIRRRHPGCNVVLCLNHDYPVPPQSEKDKWPGGTVRREQIWPSLQHEWTSDTSESNITSLVVDSMKSPPENDYWVLSATVSIEGSPTDLRPTSLVRVETFKPGFQNANVVMVDYIDGDYSRVSVVDRCIALNRLRGSDKSKPTKPTNFVVTTKNESGTGDKFQNTLVFNWTPATDNVGVRKYRIYRNDEYFATTSKFPYEKQNFLLRNYSFIVKAIDFMGHYSESSDTFHLVQDSIPPTVPENLEFNSMSSFTHVGLVWDHSIDAAGIEGYEIYLNGVFAQFVPYKATNRARTEINELDALGQYEIAIRAKDYNALYSEFTKITLYPRPALVNPKHFITGYNEVTEKYDVSVVWETTHVSFPGINYSGDTGGAYEQFYQPIAGEPPTFTFQAKHNDEIAHRAMSGYGRYNIGRYVHYNFTLNATPPNPVTNLKVISRTPTGASISWSQSSNATNYAISLNEDPPILVLSSDNSYVLEGLQSDEIYLVDVWAINDVDVCSNVASLTIEAIPGKPGQIQIDNITPKTAELYWEQSAGSVTGYELTINNEAPITMTDNTHTFVELNEATSYTVELRAFDAAGNMSEPSIASFTTKYLIPVKPGDLQVSRITHTSADIRWAASSGLEVRYQVLLNGFLIAQTAEPHFTITHLRNHFDYRVEVRAFNPGGVSDPADATFKTLLAPPANLRFSHLNGLCRLAWNPVFGKLPSHEISINGRVFNTGAGRWGYSFKLADLSPGPAPHHFTFKVRAQLDGDSSEESLLEKTLVDDVPPSQPGAPVASDITDTSVKLTWEPSSDDVGVTGYRVVLNSFLLFNTEDPSYTFTQLTPGAHHYVWVRARDKDGNLSASSKPTVFKTTGQPPAPPPSKPDVSIIDETATSLKLEWALPEGGTGVRILLNDEFWRDIPMILTSVMMRDLVPSVEYTISVSVFDVFGQLSETTVITHELKDTTAPSIPGNLRETAKTSDSVTLNWGASTDDIGLCDYVIYNNHEYFDRTPLTHYNATGLMPGTHVFEVRALDLSGNLSGPAAKTVVIREPMSAPRNFRFSYAGLILTLEWDAPEDETEINGYRIYLTGPQGTVLPYDSIQPILKPILLPRTRYGVSIMALGDGGESAPLIAEMTTK